MGKPAHAYMKDSPGDPPMVAKDIGVSRLIPLSIKELIWREEYVDIFSLLEVSPAGLDLATDKKDEDEKGKK